MGDYSDSMLTEARRRIKADPELSPKSLKTSLDLVRLDVGQIPMKTESIDCLHAGAAMHCWPDLDAAASEVFRDDVFGNLLSKCCGHGWSARHVAFPAGVPILRFGRYPQRLAREGRVRGIESQH